MDEPADALADGPGAGQDGGDGVAEPRLLPTPTADDGKSSGSRNLEGSNAHPGVSLTDAVTSGNSNTPRRLLPTPQAADGTSEQERRHYLDGGDNPTLLGAVRRSEVEWGVYEAAVRRWEAVLGEAAPAPTDERGRLEPDFVRWMLGYPADWFAVPDLPRTKALRALGNSVQVQCAEAVGCWLVGLLESGLLPS